MPGRDEFVGHVLELLAPLGPVAARRMFGGHGLYLDGLFFGLVHGGVLYLKADEKTRHQFKTAACERFTYARRGKPAALNFYRAPEDAMDAPPRMLAWARACTKNQAPSGA